jgi:hypothetical protein
VILPPPALRLLTRRKFRGWWRKQLRRMRTPSGALLALVGLTVIGLWFAWILFSVLAAGHVVRDASSLANVARGVGLVAAFFATTNALALRGLYIPREEIELLLAAPLTRADLVRHRLWAAGLRSLFGGVFMGLFLSTEAPVRCYGVLAAVLGLWTLAVWSQGISILAGAFERRVLDRLTRAARYAGVALVVLVLGCLLLFNLGEGAGPFSGVREQILQQLPRQRLSGFVQLEPLRTLALPIEPWARLASASGWLAGLPWLCLCVALWAAGLELVARLPVDFRELSLETSANVAERMRRARRGGGSVSAGKVSAASALRRVPWIFGRGPSGAIAWRKFAGMLRRARGTLLVSLVVIVLLSLLARGIGGGADEGALVRSGFFALFGTFYLCNGLRFDFREDLGRLGVLKSWPVSPWMLFCASLLPEWALVSGLLWAGLLALNVFAGGLSLALVPIFCGVPLLVAYWISIDNIVFLLAPFRATPGQDGALQNAGRGLLMGLVRLIVYCFFASTIGLAYVGTWWLLPRLGVGERLALVAATLAGLGVGTIGAGVLSWIGGRAVARFDVAREGT